MDNQPTLITNGEYTEIDSYLNATGVKRIFLVAGESINKLRINKYFSGVEERLKVVRFSDFNSNPQYDSIVKGVKVFNKEKCQIIIAVGGGSAIDVAKCIKLFSNMNHDVNYLEQNIYTNNVKLVVIPTTAGSGSEATQFATIYLDGEKQSISDNSCIPSKVFFDFDALKTLPIYQRKVTMLDALCHAIESYWSINSTEYSRAYAKEAIEKIFENKEAYLSNQDTGNLNMLYAANLAGRAINISQTTAGHALSYKITSMYGIAHGHAVALCVSKIFPYMIENIDRCIDPRGKDYLLNIFNSIAKAMGCADMQMAVEKLDILLRELSLDVPIALDNDFTTLKETVNSNRLKNNPVEFDIEDIDTLYHQILLSI